MVIHCAVLVVCFAYGFYHCVFGVFTIGVFAFGSGIFCGLSILQIARRAPKSAYYYGLMLCQLVALLLTCYYFGLRGLALITPYISGVFFLFPFKQGIWLSGSFVVLALAAAFPNIEITLFIRLAIAQIITLFFLISASHLVSRQQAELEREAYYDYLTDVLNRRGFIRWLKTELLKLKQESSDLAFFYIDMDKFKQVNDTYGHSVGDQLLVAFANRVVSTLRTVDIIKQEQQVCNFSRISGDEFALAISRLSDIEAAKAIAARLNSALAQPFHIEQEHIDVSVSMGVCFASQADYDDAKLFLHADMAMYTSKEFGRNQTNFFQPVK